MSNAVDISLFHSKSPLDTTAQTADSLNGSYISNQIITKENKDTEGPINSKYSLLPGIVKKRMNMRNLKSVSRISSMQGEEISEGSTHLSRDSTRIKSMSPSKAKNRDYRKQETSFTQGYSGTSNQVIKEKDRIELLKAFLPNISKMDTRVSAIDLQSKNINVSGGSRTKNIAPYTSSDAATSIYIYIYIYI